MSEQDHLYVLIRVRKSGSQSLVKIMQDAYPESRLHPMPHDPPTADLGVGFKEEIRLARRQRKRLRKLYKTTSYPEAWKRCNQTAKSGDIVGGHFPYGTPDLPDFELRYITIMRHPLKRLYSEYRYCKQSFDQRPWWRRLYTSARIQVAGRGSFGDYIDYLDQQGEHFTNPLVAYITNGDRELTPYEFLRKHYYHYGLIERAQSFAAKLSSLTGRDVPAAWKNKTRDTGALDGEYYDEAKVQRLIGEDLKLYDAVLAEIDGNPA